MAPTILTQAFRQALHELSADMRVKLIIYKLFDRYVLSSLEELYQEINTELARAGVLPQLRHEVTRAGHAKSADTADGQASTAARSEEHTSELQSLMRISYAVFCLKKKKLITSQQLINTTTSDMTT